MAETQQTKTFARLVGGSTYTIGKCQQTGGKTVVFTAEKGWTEVSSVLADYLEETAVDKETRTRSGRRTSHFVAKFEFADMTDSEAVEANRNLRLRDQRSGDMQAEEVQEQPRTRNRRRGPSRS